MSGLIRFQTRSEYSHSAILLDDGETIFESWPGAGVRTKKVRNWDGIDKFRIIPPVNWAPALRFAESQLGKPYDYVQVMRFVTRQGGKENASWFCAEYSFRIVERGGVQLLRTDEAFRIHPGHLGLSPLIELE